VISNGARSRLPRKSTLRSRSSNASSGNELWISSTSSNNVVLLRYSTSSLWQRSRCERLRSMSNPPGGVLATGNGHSCRVEREVHRDQLGRLPCPTNVLGGRGVGGQRHTAVATPRAGRLGRRAVGARDRDQLREARRQHG